MGLIRRIGLLLVFAIISIYGDQAFAQDGRPVLSGELNFEDTTEKSADSYSNTQQLTIDFFKDFLTTLTATGPVAELSDSQLNYLNAVYLYCSINTGKCPFILDAILETDVKRSAMSGVASCPAMTKFWKQWVANDMENRHKYSVRTAFLSVTEEFRTKDRPKYLKCKDNVSSSIAGMTSPAALFSTRYAEGSEPRRAIERTIEYLKAVQASGQNIATSLGIKAPSANSSGSKSKGSAPGAKSSTKKPPIKSHR